MLKKINVAVFVAFFFNLLLCGLVLAHTNEMIELLNSKMDVLSSNSNNLKQMITHNIHEPESFKLLVYFVGILLSACLLSIWWVVRHNLIKPIMYLQAQLRNIANGDLVQDIDSENSNEIGKTVMSVK